MLFLLSSKILSTYVKNAVCINIKCNFNLRNTTRGWSNTIKLELSNNLIITTHRTFTLKNHNRYTRLIIYSSCKDLTFLSRNSCISFNQFSHHIAVYFNTQSNRSNIKKQYIIFSWISN